MARSELDNRQRERRTSSGLSPDLNRYQASRKRDRDKSRETRTALMDQEEQSPPSRLQRNQSQDRPHKYRSRSRSPRPSGRSRNRSNEKLDLERRRDLEGFRTDYKLSRHRRSASPSRSPRPPNRRRPSITGSRSPSPQSSRRSRVPLPPQKNAFARDSNDILPSSTAALEKEKPNFSNTGRLAVESNTVVSADGSASIVLKYHEPPEARKPPAKDPWRLYVFKGHDLLETIELSRRSCWLIGRERFVVDLPVDHPSCSKQHAAIQFRYVEKRNEFGDRDGRIRPYLIDLESANGSMVNGEPLLAGRYMELLDKDVLTFGLSTREYVLMLPPPD